MIEMLPTLLAAAVETTQAQSFWSYLRDILILLAGAMVLGGLFERFRQSPIVGYLLAGALLGPNILNLVHNEQGIAAIAELGVALLLFSIGLEFSVARLRRFGPRALVAGTLQVVVTLAIAAGIARVCGLSAAAAVAVGAMVALSSTAVVLRTLADRAEVDSVRGRGALGVLLVQDVAVIPLVLLVQALGGGGSTEQAVIGMGREVLLAALLVGGFFLLARYAMPLVVRTQAIRRSREGPILFAIVLAIASAGAAHAVGLSPALGAFAAGVVLGESPLATQIRADVGPFRTLFVTLFFSAIGMLGSVAWATEHAGLVLAVIAGCIVGKAAIVWAILRLQKLAHRHAIATGLCLGQVGEFSFVIASAAAGGVIGDDTFALLVSVTIGTLLVTPTLVGHSAAIGEAVESGLRRLGLIRAPHADSAPPDTASLSGHVIVIGFGPAGRAVADALRPRNVPIAVIDLNPRSIYEAASLGLHAHVGDATLPEILEHTRVTAAAAVIVTLPDHRAALATVRQTRAVCPQVPVIARARYNLYVRDFEDAGCDAVVDEESSVGRRLGEAANQAV